MFQNLKESLLHISIPSDHAKGCKSLNQYINAKFYCNEETYNAIPIRENSKVCIKEGKQIELCNFKK